MTTTKTNGVDNYVIRGVSIDGAVKYYTGRAGADNWLSPDIKNAFGYQSLEGARRKATSMNRMTQIHGVWFTVPWIREYLEQSA
jgi:hypothetical protein